MNKDTAQADPAEGSRDVIERELERQEKAQANAKEPKRDCGDENKGKQRKPH
jgi:hypothetical protein